MSARAQRSAACASSARRPPESADARRPHGSNLHRLGRPRPVAAHSVSQISPLGQQSRPAAGPILAREPTRNAAATSRRSRSIKRSLSRRTAPATPSLSMTRRSRWPCLIAQGAGDRGAVLWRAQRREDRGNAAGVGRHGHERVAADKVWPLKELRGNR